VIRSGWGGSVTYATATITAAGRGRVRLDNGQSFYMRTGKNCWEPKGQTWLMEPTPENVALVVTGVLPGRHRP
jgi:quercetin dioxygenase-like cupin family protein